MQFLQEAKDIIEEFTKEPHDHNYTVGAMAAHIIFLRKENRRLAGEFGGDKLIFSNCCSEYMPDWPDSDICPRCKEHCDKEQP